MHLAYRLWKCSAMWKDLWNFLSDQIIATRLLSLFIMTDRSCNFCIYEQLELWFTDYSSYICTIWHTSCRKHCSLMVLLTFFSEACNFFFLIHSTKLAVYYTSHSLWLSEFLLHFVAETIKKPENISVIYPYPDNFK